MTGLSARHAVITLFCLPNAGGSAAGYHRWKRPLGAGIEVVPLELPGRGQRISEGYIRQFDALVAVLADQVLRAARPRYALFGHSMGALLSYGIARHLARQQRPLPERLLVSACAAPSRRDNERFANCQSDEALIAELHTQGGTPAMVFEDAELLRMTLDTMAADYQVCNSFEHRPATPLSCPIHAFAGRQDTLSADTIDAWGAETGGGFSRDWFDGGHFYLHQQEPALLQRIQQLLGAQSGRP